MNDFVLDLESNEWRIAHCHHNSLHLNESEHYLDSWRSAVERQGCHFVGNVMFRESLSHTLSLYKHLKRYNSTTDEWTRHLKTQSELGHWATELDFFLYNNLARNPVSCGKIYRFCSICCQYLCSILTYTFSIRADWGSQRRKGQKGIRTTRQTL